MSALLGRVVVITGASSGLGRAAAVEFAKRGCALVLAARRAEELERTAQDCRSLGGPAWCIPTDVTSEVQVLRLAARTLELLGRIDVWVNNAGVTVFARLHEVPFREHQRVLDTNLNGAMYGARAVMPIFSRQGHGTLINVGSIVSKIGQPFVPSYAVSKFALRGLSEVLRVEYADHPKIHVCLLMPYAIDTPHFESGANHLGRQPHAMPPVQSPEQVAQALVELAERPRRERHVPRLAWLGLVLHELMPRTIERVLLRALSRWHFAQRLEPDKPGNLLCPAPSPGQVHGTRPPLVSTARLFAWAATELVRIRLRDLAFWLSRAAAWATRAAHGTSSPAALRLRSAVPITPSAELGT
ncbi:MAG TPA: SDR family oxidoreductase [Polyangiaceae bacterium]|nr:SDR family oxidoreductase [Polyangiaceae bacterium]